MPSRDGKGLTDLSVRHIDALLRYHYKIDPTELSDEDWAMKWNDLQFCLTFEKDHYRNILI